MTVQLGLSSLVITLAVVFVVYFLGLLTGALAAMSSKASAIERIQEECEERIFIISAQVDDYIKEFGSGDGR